MDNLSGLKAPAALQTRGIVKMFGGVHALRGVAFELLEGEVHALLGENGAGKSTLMNVIAGNITDYQGSIILGGLPTRFASPADARDAGIALIPQELDLVHGLSIAENLFMGREPHRLGFVDQGRMRAESVQLLNRVGLQRSPRQNVGELRIGERQLVAIAKALALRARILIMDEPTAALTSFEVARLFEVVGELRGQGVGVIYISHRLEEVPLVADRVTVMRDGLLVGTRAADTPQSTLVQMLVGRPTDELYPPRRERPAGAEVLRLTGVGFSPYLPSSGYQPPAGVSLDVSEGEIVGLAGLLGAGRTELLELLYGAGPAGAWSGSIELGQELVRPTSIRKARRLGIAFVGDDRRSSGFVPQLSVGRNIVLGALRAISRFGFIRSRRERPIVQQVMEEYAIRAASPDLLITSLSGGNQQKVVLAKNLIGTARLLLLDEPTRGVDVGAKAEIYRLLRRLADKGLAVLVASSEMPELIGLCDRLFVLQGGRTVAEFPGGADEDEILAAAGVRLSSQNSAPAHSVTREHVANIRKEAQE